jgi:hypothetical protein
MSFIAALYPEIKKEETKTYVFKPKPKLETKLNEKSVSVKKEVPVEKVVKHAPPPSPVKVEVPKPVAASGGAPPPEPPKKGPKKPRFVKGSEEAREWSKEMALRRKINRDKKPVLEVKEEPKE